MSNPLAILFRGVGMKLSTLIPRWMVRSLRIGAISVMVYLSSFYFLMTAGIRPFDKDGNESDRFNSVFRFGGIEPTRMNGHSSGIVRVSIWNYFFYPAEVILWN